VNLKPCTSDLSLFLHRKINEYEKIKQEIQKLKKEVETEANEKVKSQNGGDEKPAP